MSPEEFSRRFDVSLDAPVRVDQTKRQILDQEQIASSLGGYITDEELDEPESALIRKSRAEKLLKVVLASVSTVAVLITGYLAHEKFGKSDCIEADQDIDLHPDFAGLFTGIEQIDFVENDMNRLDHAKDRITEASSLADSKEIATRYLKEIGINLHFDDLPNVGIYNLGRNRMSVGPINAAQRDQQMGISHLIGNFAATPRSVIDNSGIENFYVVDSLVADNQGYGGRAGSEGLIPFLSDKGYVVISLEEISGRERSDRVYWHEIFHRLDERQCRPTESDEEFRKLNPEGYNYRAPFNEVDASQAAKLVESFSAPSDYALRNTLEDKASSFDELIQGGFSAPNTERGESVLAKKQELLVGRIVAQTGEKNLPLLIEFFRIYGHDTHPLRVMSEQTAPYSEDEWRPAGIMDLPEEIRVMTAMGYITLHCGRQEAIKEGDQADINRCATALNASVEVFNDETPVAWHGNLESIVRQAGASLIDGELRVIGASGELDKNYPQESVAEFSIQLVHD